MDEFEYLLSLKIDEVVQMLGLGEVDVTTQEGYDQYMNVLVSFACELNYLEATNLSWEDALIYLEDLYRQQCAINLGYDTNTTWSKMLPFLQSSFFDCDDVELTRRLKFASLCALYQISNKFYPDSSLLHAFLKRLEA